MIKHCEHCDDTGLIYRVVMTRGGGTKYIRIPCPDCAQIGLNTGAVYVDEKYTQIDLFKDAKSNQKHDDRLMSMAGGITMVKYIENTNIFDAAAKQYADARALEEFYGLVVGDIYDCEGRRCLLVSYMVAPSDCAVATIEMLPRLACTVTMLDNGAEWVVPSNKLKRRG